MNKQHLITGIPKMTKLTKNRNDLIPPVLLLLFI